MSANVLFYVIVKKCHFGTMVGWVKGFESLFETYYLLIIAYGRSQINISENPLPILQKNHFLTIILCLIFTKTIKRKENCNGRKIRGLYLRNLR